MVDKFTVQADHPSLQGHFPGNPVVPGVVILNEIVRRVEQTFMSQTVAGINYIKFIKPLRSDIEVELRFDEGKTGVVSFACEGNESVIVKGQLVLSGKDAA